MVRQEAGVRVMDDAILHFDYATRDFESIMRKQEAATPEEREALVSQTVLALYSYLHSFEASGFAERSARAVQLLRAVVSQLVAYCIAQCGRENWKIAFDDDSHLNVLIRGLYPHSLTAALQRTTIWHMSQWVVEGRRVFAPSEALCKRLERIELRGVSGDDIALPFRSFYVVVPYGVGVPIPDYNEAVFPLRGLYVLEDEYDSDTLLRGRVVHVLAVGQWRSLGDTGHHDDQLYYWTMPLCAGRGALLASQERITRSWERADCDHLVDTKTPLRQLHALNRWIWHLLVYLSSSDVRRELRYLDPEVERLEQRLRKHPKGRKRDRIKDALKQRSRQRVIVIGSDVQAPPQSQGKGTPLEVRQLVRGHRKRQPFGPQRQERKEITIAPYWRGPEDGEQGGSRFMLR